MLVGVPTPEMTLELPLIDVFGRGGALKSSWYGDCLPVPRLPDADRPVPAGPAALDALRHRDDRPRRRRGGVRRRCTTATCCARWWCSDERSSRIEHLRHLAAPSPSTAAPGRSTTTSGWSATTTRCVVIDAAHDAGRDRGGRRRPHGDRHRVHPRPRRPHRRRARRWPTRPARRSCCTRPTASCGSMTHPDRTPDASSPTAPALDGGRHRRSRAAHPGPRARRGLPLRARARRRVQRRHAVRRRPGRDRPLVQRLPARSSTRSATGC